MNDANSHRTLRAFIKEAGISNRKFAMIAGIPPSTFQAMLDRGSDMKQGTFDDIVDAMIKIIDESDDATSERLNELWLAFVNENVMASCKYALKDALLKPHSPDYMESFASVFKQSYPPAQRELIDDIFKQNTSADLLQSTRQNVNTCAESQRTRMNAAFDQLNPEGQAVAADQVENLTYNPKYQKKESE